MVPIPVILELESPIIDSHIRSWENECGLEFQLLDLDPLPEPVSTLEPLLDLSQIPKSVVILVLPMSKSIIPSFHTPFWDKGIDNNDSEIILRIWKLDGVKFIIKIINIYIILEVFGRFLRTPHKLGWAAFRGPIRPPPEPPS